MMVDREERRKRLRQNRLLPSGLVTNRQARREGFGGGILRTALPPGPAFILPPHFRILFEVSR